MTKCTNHNFEKYFFAHRKIITNTCVCDCSKWKTDLLTILSCNYVYCERAIVLFIVQLFVVYEYINKLFHKVTSADTTLKTDWKQIWKLEILTCRLTLLYLYVSYQKLAISAVLIILQIRQELDSKNICEITCSLKKKKKTNYRLVETYFTVVTWILYV